MDWINRFSATFLLCALFGHPIQGLKFRCNNITCRLEHLDLNEDYTFAFSYSFNTTYQLTAMYVKGDIFDLTTLPNLSNLRNFALHHSQLDSVIVRLAAERSTLTVTHTPLKTIILHQSRNLVDIRIDVTLLETIPDTIFEQELLQTLFITHSLLTVVDFTQFEKLPNLSSVDFSFNKIHVVHIPPESTCCRRLITLELQQNRLERFDFGLVSHMNCLEVITLKSNRLQKLEIIEPRGKPPNLTQYCTALIRGLGAKQIEKAESYSRYASLTTIDLEGNRIKELNLSMFVSIPNLMDLLVGKNQLSSVLVTDGQLPMRLQYIDLSFNRLANADLRPIFSVKTVNVGGNQ